MEEVTYRRMKENPNYFIGNNQQVFSLHRGKFLRLQRDKDGYVIIALNKKKYKMHRVMYRNYISEIPEGMVIDHLDHVKENNDLSNLLLSSNGDNTNRSRRHYLSTGEPNNWVGGRHPNTKLSEAQAQYILDVSPTKYSMQKEIAARFGISDCLVRDIVKRRAWKHLNRSVEVPKD